MGREKWENCGASRPNKRETTLDISHVQAYDNGIKLIGGCRLPEGDIKIKRTYKDSVFRLLFRDRDKLLSLYNAIYGREYDDPGQIEVTTLENAVYMGMKNDISCIVDFNLSLFEHQSTVNPNMPLRYLMYISDVYEKVTAEKNIYSSGRIILLNPDFVVLYNGQGKQPEKKVLLLSDSYHHREEKNGLELRVLQLNINPGCNEEIMARCPVLKEYSLFVARVRRHEGHLPVPEAVDRAVRECIEEGILGDFLVRNRSEVVRMSIYEYDEEKHLQAVREEGLAEGLEKGLEKGLARGKEQGIQQGKEQLYYRMFSKNKTPEDISDFTGESVEYLYDLKQEYLAAVQEESQYN